jgi:hypothetical protein
LVSKNPAVTEVEQTLDNTKGDGQSILAQFVDWQAAGPSYSFNEIRNELSETQKSNSMPANYFYMFYVIRLQKPNNGWKETWKN